jgi:hypothetical protein
MFVIIWALIWLLGVMLGINCIRLGIRYLVPRPKLPQACQQATICVVMARALGLCLVLLGVLFIYAVCAPFPELPGHKFFKKIYLM